MYRARLRLKQSIEDASPLPGKPPCLLDGYERLAGAGTAAGDNTRVRAEPGEKLALLVGEPDQLLVGSLGTGTK